jgi:hypothetical protein
MLNTYGRLNTAFGEQGDHVPNLNPELYGKDTDDRVEGNPAAATPPGDKPNAEQHLVEDTDEVTDEDEGAEAEAESGAEPEDSTEPAADPEAEVEPAAEPEPEADPADLPVADDADAPSDEA